MSYEAVHQVFFKVMRVADTTFDVPTEAEWSL